MTSEMYISPRGAPNQKTDGSTATTTKGNRGKGGMESPRCPIEQENCAVHENTIDPSFRPSAKRKFNHKSAEPTPEDGKKERRYVAARQPVKRPRNVGAGSGVNFTFQPIVEPGSTGISFGCSSSSSFMDSPIALGSFVQRKTFAAAVSAIEPMQNLNLSTGVSPADSPLPMGSGATDSNELSVLSLPANLVETSTICYENSVQMDDVADLERIMGGGNAEESARNSPDAIYKAASLSNTTASPDELSAADIDPIDSCQKEVDLGSMVQGLYFDEKTLAANASKEKCISSFALQSPSFASPRAAFGKTLLCHEKLDSPAILGNSFREYKTQLASPNFMGDIEPLRSSPVVKFDKQLSKKAETSMSGSVLVENEMDERDNPFEDENSVAPPHAQSEEDKCNHVDYSPFFELRQKNDPESEGRKWLEFKCSKLSEPVKNEDGSLFQRTDGLISPFELDRPSVISLARPETLSNHEEPEEATWRQEIWESWRKVECDYLPYAPAISQSLNLDARVVLVNWLMEAAQDYNMYRQTFQTALNILDRFYSKITGICLDLHQILACCALFISAKKEEIEPPTIQNMLIHCAAPLLTAAQFRSIEMKMIQVLEWQLTPPTHFDWLCLYFRMGASKFYEEFRVRVAPIKLSSGGAGDASSAPPPGYEPAKLKCKKPNAFRKELFIPAVELIDLLLHRKQSLNFSPSILSAAVFYLSVCMRFRESIREEIFEVCTQYKLEQLGACLEFTEDVARRQALHPVACYSDDLASSADKMFHQPSYGDLHNYINDLDNNRNENAALVRTDEDYSISNVVNPEDQQ